MTASHGVFAFAHIGDLHLERAEDRHAADLRTILAEVAGLHGHGLLDFAYLPGDLAEDGRAEQYAVLREALDRHPALPVRLIAGDHDRQHGTMADFDALFAAVAGSPELRAAARARAPRQRRAPPARLAREGAPGRPARAEPQRPGLVAGPARIAAHRAARSTPPEDHRNRWAR
ncbi:metallophosphoesterase family protein [Methylobacterium oryzae]|uniref:metallophosphoesterase family protein n=1 Tax=Methylobacterium oryzae TaxID=334852 RepID=UPI002F35EDE6